MAASVTTREVLLDYVRFRLNEAGLSGDRIKPIRGLFIGIPVAESVAMDEVRCVGKQLESHLYHSAFLDMSEQQFDILSDSAKSDYHNVLTQLFIDRKINWGRLVMVIVYTGRLAVSAMKQGCPDQIGNLVEWCTSFFKNNYLDQWIAANGGWDKVRGVYATDWERKEIRDELKCLSWGLLIIAGVVLTGAYILHR